MMALHFKVQTYKASDAENIERNYRDLTKISDPNRGRTYTQYEAFNFNGKAFFAFSDVHSLPAERYLNASSLVQLATIECSNEDLKDAFTKANKLMETDLEAAKRFLVHCQQITELTNELEKWLNLAGVFLMFEEENPLFYEMKYQQPKKAIFAQLDKKQKRAVAEFARDQFARLMQTLYQIAPECFEGQQSKTDFFEVLQSFDKINVSMNLMLRQVSENDLQKRDMLMQYPIGDLYADIRYMMLESEKTKKALEPK